MKNKPIKEIDSSRLAFIRALIEEIEGMKDMFACNDVIPESEIENRIIFNKGDLEALQKSLIILKKK